MLKWIPGLEDVHYESPSDEWKCPNKSLYVVMKCLVEVLVINVSPGTAGTAEDVV